MDPGVETPGPWRTAPFSWRDDLPLVGVEPAPGHLAQVQIVYQVGQQYAGRALEGAECVTSPPSQRQVLDQFQMAPRLDKHARGDSTERLGRASTPGLVIT